MTSDEYRDRIAEAAALKMLSEDTIVRAGAKAIAAAAYALADAMWERRERGKTKRGEFDEPIIKNRIC